jgi:hypothetical protein
MSDDDRIVIKAGRLIHGQNMWKGKAITEGNAPMDYKLYHEHNRLTGKGWFPGDDLSGPPSVIPWHLWLEIDFTQGWDGHPSQVQLPDGGRIVGFHIAPTKSEDDPRQGELPLDEKPADLRQRLIDWAKGIPHSRDEYEAAARGIGVASGVVIDRNEVRRIIKHLPEHLWCKRGETLQRKRVDK